jgi:MoaA/NifB/PqqE/SkfB family radical SAM enzyme
MDRMSVWLTPRCNLRCSYCFQQDDRGAADWPPKGPRASAALINALGDFCVKNKVRHVEFFGGEPLYYPETFINTVKSLRRKVSGLSLGLVTNGTLLDENIMRLLEEHAVAVLLSLDGGKTRHNELRGGFEKISPWFDRLSKLSNISIALQAGMIPGLAKNIRAVWRCGFKHVFVNIVESYGWYQPRDIQLFEKEYETAIRAMLEGEGQISCALRIYKTLNGTSYTQECGIIRKGLCCDWRGDLYPCHRAVELGKDFAIGTIDGGVDKEAEGRIRAKIEKKAFCGGNTGKYKLVSFCPVTAAGHYGKLSNKWNTDFCDLVNIKNKLVAKHHYAIEAFAAKLKPATQPAKSGTEEQTPACAPPANNERITGMNPKASFGNRFRSKLRGIIPSA